MRRRLHKRVRVPKLEHREGLGTRIVRLFPELVGPLLELFNEASQGAESATSPSYRIP